MVTISNELASTSPLPEPFLESEAAAAFEAAGDRIQDGINAYLKSLSSRSDAQNYKFVVFATKVDTSARGPLKTYTGAYWNADHDGSWVTHLAKQDLLVTVVWIRL